VRPASHPVRVGLIGCGMAAGEYAATISASTIATVTACADLRHHAAADFARRHHIPHILAVAGLLDPAVTDIAVVLTPPPSHARLAAEAIAAGLPGVYVEKPITTSPQHADALADAADRADCTLAAAPDTILGAPAQTARAAITAGLLGDIVAASASYLSSGPERWHPSPEPFHAPGAGPLADMGPYYLAALTYLLGPIRLVTGAVATTQPHRMIATGPKAGHAFTARAPTHVTALLQTGTGAPVSFTASFDTAGTRGPHLEIHGTSATLVLPDPNFHTGGVILQRTGERQWQPLAPAEPAITPAGRGMGVLALAATLLGTAVELPCTGRAAAHVVSIIDAIYQAAISGAVVRIR